MKLPPAERRLHISCAHSLTKENTISTAKPMTQDGDIGQLAAETHLLSPRRACHAHSGLPLATGTTLRLHPETDNEAVSELEQNCDGEQLRELRWVRLEKRRLRRDCITLQLLKERCGEAASTSASSNSNRMKGDGLTLYQGRFRLGISACSPLIE